MALKLSTYPRQSVPTPPPPSELSAHGPRPAPPHTRTYTSTHAHILYVSGMMMAESWVADAEERWVGGWVPRSQQSIPTTAPINDVPSGLAGYIYLPIDRLVCAPERGTSMLSQNLLSLYTRTPSLYMCTQHGGGEGKGDDEEDKGGEEEA